MIESAIEYDDGADGDQGDIELVFADTAEQAASPGTVLALGTNITVYLNGNDITSRFTISSTNAANSRYVLTSGTDILPTDTLTVSIDNATDGSGNFAVVDNRTVTITAATVRSDTASPQFSTHFNGSLLAIDFGSTGSTYEITEDADPFLGPFSTGKGAVAVFDSSRVSISSTYNVSVDTSGDGFGDAVGATMSFRLLSLSTTADSASLATDSDLRASISASAGSRQVQVELLFAGNNSVADRAMVTLSGSGHASVNFGPQATGTYLVRATDTGTGISAVTDEIVVGQIKDFMYTVSLEGGQTYAIGFPGPMNRTYGETFGHFNGTIWAYDATANSWRHPGSNEPIEPLDAVYVVAEEDAVVPLTFERSESQLGAPGEKHVSAGWNFIAAPQYSGAESAFAATTTEPKRILQTARQPGNQPFPAGGDFGWYAFGSGSDGPHVSAFTGYWVFMAGNGTVGANLYKGVTKTEAEMLLTNSTG